MTLFIHNREELEHHLVALHGEGWSIRGLARHFSIGRNTIRKILRKYGDQRENGHDILLETRKKVIRSSKLDPFAGQIKEILEEFPGLSGQRIFEKLQDSCYDGGISILRERLRILRPSSKKTPIVRFETDPGLQGQMDWSPYTIHFTNSEKIQVNCFSYILGFSRRQYIDFTPRRDFYTLIRRHQDAFNHFGGVPRHCLYDSEKTVVLRWEAGQPVFNPSFSAFITHYHCRPIACQRGRPQTKGKIERPFQYVENNLLAGRKFRDLDDLKTCAGWWLRQKSDLHVHDTTGRPPLELFMEQEQDALQPLPRHPYDCAEVYLRVCDLEGYIEFETNRYPVPYEYVADILTLKATEHEIIIYSAELALLVRHQRLAAGSVTKLDPSGIHSSRKIRYSLQPVQDQFLAMGDHSRDFLEGLKQQHPKNCGFHARYILRQKEKYHVDDIDKAMAHACRYHAYDCKAIERILLAKSSPRTLEAIRNEKAAEELRNALPKIRQRPLAEYDSLLGGIKKDGQRSIGTNQEEPEHPENENNSRYT
jgi:transposase